MAEIIRGPWAGSDHHEEPEQEPMPASMPAPGSDKAPARPQKTVNISQEQADWLNKLNGMLGQVLGGQMSLVVVGILPAGRGHDFYTIVEGVPEELRKALPELEGVIERAYGRKGI